MLLLFVALAAKLFGMRLILLWRPLLLALTLPAWFMLLFNAAVAVNQVRYNLMLVPPLAISGAIVALRLLRLRRRRRPPRPA